MGNLNPQQLWAAITETPRPSVVVDFPRNGADGKPIGQLRIQVLTQEEQLLCSAEAERFTKKAIKDLPKTDEAQLGYQNVYNNSAAVEVLFHACRRVDDPKEPFFPSREALKKYLTPDEVGILMMHYYTTQSELGPIVAHLSKEEVDAWVEKLAEGGSRYPLDLLSSEALKDLAFSLACRIHNSAMATSSHGSLPEKEQNEAEDPSSPQMSLSL